MDEWKIRVDEISIDIWHMPCGAYALWVGGRNVEYGQYRCVQCNRVAPDDLAEKREKILYLEDKFNGLC